jgi:hypothetical protein
MDLAAGCEMIDSLTAQPGHLKREELEEDRHKAAHYN